ncbi:globin-like protein [Sporodiniella umbellata]|nr:globin-like protein [Sporodiniella umbellata]
MAQSKPYSIRSVMSSSHSLKKLFQKDTEKGPTQAQIDLIRLSWEKVSHMRHPTDDRNISPAHAFGLAFYEALFELCPEVQALFHDVIQQAKALTGMISFIARAPSLTKEKNTTIKEMNSKPVEEEDPEWLAAQMRDLGARHYFYRIHPHHFDFVGPAFVSALKKRLDREYTETIGDAWLKATVYVAYQMSIGFESQQNNSKKQRHSKSSCILQ